MEKISVRKVMALVVEQVHWRALEERNYSIIDHNFLDCLKKRLCKIILLGWI